MLKSLKIENFRCFQSFEMQQLGRLNLIVGTNNSGKTSILEAIQLLVSPSLDFEVIGEIIIGRSEYIENEEYRDKDLVIRHLFYGHKIDLGSKISIVGQNDIETKEEMVVSIEIDHESPSLVLKKTERIRDIENSNSLDSKNGFGIQCLLSKEGNISLKLLQNARKSLVENPSHIQFVNSSSLTTDKAIELFELVVLTPEEDLVTQSLQIVEPRIKRIATLSSEKYRYKGTRSGFIVQLPENSRIPIGNMGDGMWRMLGLALAIVNAKDGVLLVDEIDTGLHFTVMSDMWKMLWETAKRLNVQIFATTHSNDCWQSLADIANAENPNEDGITIHRIEKGKPHSIVFTEDEIAIAAEEGIEVR
jgi:AAA15 family ATPase/GTPase